MPVTNAQTVFAPAGSEWYYTMAWGVFHCYNSGDTTIAGTACRKISRKALYITSGPNVDDLPTLYVYNTTDTIFAYYTIFGQFTPLYVFNVNDGDTVRLPVFQMDIGDLYTGHPDSTFSFRVDSVRMKVYDTATLKTVYTHAIGTTGSDYVFYYNGLFDSLGTFAQQIGALNISLMPIGSPGVILTTESLQLGTELRCYNDPSTSIKLVSQACDYPLEVVPVSGIPVSIFPNPSADFITIANVTIGTLIEITDMAGRKIQGSTTVSGPGNTTLSLSSLPSGVYLFKMIPVNGTTEYRKISVLH